LSCASNHYAFVKRKRNGWWMVRVTRKYGTNESKEDEWKQEERKNEG
jgi:hypothetical protein